MVGRSYLVVPGKKVPSSHPLNADTGKSSPSCRFITSQISDTNLGRGIVDIEPPVVACFHSGGIVTS